MLCCFKADVTAFFVADVVATAVLADVIAKWLMLNPPMGVCGRCYGHWVNVLIFILMLYLRPHPIFCNVPRGSHNFQLLSH